MEMTPMLLIITIATYTLGKIAMTAVPIEGKKKKILIRCPHLFYVLFYYCTVVHTYGKAKRSQDVDDLNAQVKVVEVLLKDGWRKKKYS